MLAELTLLMASCAPNVAPSTLEALVRHESRGNAYAIGVNTGKRLKTQPDNLEHALKTVQHLIREGTDFDAGLGQINVRNWNWLGLTSTTVFDPCTNLEAAQTVLSECYGRAIKRYPDPQQAVRAALSCYNTGNFDRGFSNGYVGKVLAEAGITVPAIKPTPEAREKYKDPNHPHHTRIKTVLDKTMFTMGFAEQAPMFQHRKARQVTTNCPSSRSTHAS
ncbi:hypothetical protein OURE66S_03578 [Oligella ureolytica]